MSYILDALKKSEQQRQSAEPESVTERILINQPQVVSNNKKWLVLLGLLNLLAVSYFIGFVNFTDTAVNFPAKAQNEVVRENQNNTIAEAQANFSSQNPSSPQPIIDSQLQPSSPSIADMMSTEESAAIERKPVPKAIEKKSLPAKKPSSIRSTSIREPVAYAGNTAMKRSRYEMPVEEEDRRPVNIEESRPPLTINVFSYAPNPQERFVMINMTKYKVGQLIKDGIKLKAIHPDHIVLQQGNSTFKMDRP